MRGLGRDGVVSPLPDRIGTSGGRMARGGRCRFPAVLVTYREAGVTQGGVPSCGPPFPLPLPLLPLRASRLIF
eukprot:14515949-Heterocapsa_arctica.AAC.1